METPEETPEARTWPAVVKLLGAQHATHPPKFGFAEGLARSWAVLVGAYSDLEGERFMEALIADLRTPLFLSAVLGLSVPGLVKAKLQGHGYDVFAFGEAAYTELREKGATTTELITAGLSLANTLSTVIQSRTKAVEGAKGF